MLLNELTRKKVVGCPPDATITEVAKLMRDEDVGCVVVLDEGKLAGIVTDRDIVLRCIGDGLNCANTPIEEVMTADVGTVNVEDTIYEIVERMKQSKVRRVPIVDEFDNVVGVVSSGDLFGLLLKELQDLSEALVPEFPKLSEAA